MRDWAENYSLEKIMFQGNVTEHCNLGCAHCTHFSPLAQEEYLSSAVWKRDCERMRELFGDKVVLVRLLGGEPLLHPQLPKIIGDTREIFTSATILLFTNGILLGKDDSLLKCFADNKVTVRLSMYPHLTTADWNERIKALMSHNIEWEHDGRAPGRCTMSHKQLDLNGEQDGTTQYKKCFFARTRCQMQIRNGRLSQCVIPHTVRHFNAAFGQSVKVEETDTIDIHTHSADEIVSFLEHATPMCRYCKSCETGKPWRLSERKIEEWT